MDLFIILAICGFLVVAMTRAVSIGRRRRTSDRVDGRHVVGDPHSRGRKWKAHMGD